jgi:hypothetical protein
MIIHKPNSTLARTSRLLRTPIMPAHPRAWRVLSTMLLAYIGVAVFYATYVLVLQRVAQYFVPFAGWKNDIRSPFSIISLEEDRLPTVTSSVHPITGQHPMQAISSASSAFLSSDALSSYHLTLLSKAFSGSLQPNNIVPFYYRYTGRFDQDDITIATLVTMDRFPVFAKLVEKYAGRVATLLTMFLGHTHELFAAGPISVVIHVPPNTSVTTGLLTSLHSLYTSTPSYADRVDVHLALSPHARLFNAWRNAARALARTHYVMMLDVDFAVCTNFRTAVRASREAKMRMDQGDVLVVPAFEYITLGEGWDSGSFPQTKTVRHLIIFEYASGRSHIHVQNLLDLVKLNRLDVFHRSWPVGHSSTDYNRFYATPPGEVYPVTEYQSAYEPYVIFRKDAVSWYVH